MFLKFCDIKDIDKMINEIAEFLKDNCEDDYDIVNDARYIVFDGKQCNTSLCLNLRGQIGYGSLVVQRVNLENKRCGTFTKIVNLLVEYCRKNDIKEILIENVISNEMEHFCIKNNFKEQNNGYDFCQNYVKYI